MKNAYFRMKVQKGNSYYPHFRDGKLGGLWIGWDQSEVAGSKTKRPGESRSSRANKRELTGILDCLENEKPDTRRIVFLWDRERQEICFWEIQGKHLEPLSREKVEKALHDLPEKEREKVISTICKGQLIPARPLKSFPRSVLPAFIDSLSVYTYLNMGTFRALSSVSQLKRKELGLFPGDDPETSEFAKLVAKYFDWLLEDTQGSFADYAGLSGDQVKKMVLTFMSPAQLETFGSLLLMDLGLTLELGVGKSLSEIDLRASYRHRPNHEKIHGEILEKLKAIKARMSPAAEKLLKEHQTIFVQCKNYSASAPNEKILLLSQGSQDGSHFVDLNTFTDESFDFKNQFPRVFDWVEQATTFFSSPKEKVIGFASASE